jgi:predicted GNAT family acetyltransferase
MFFDIEFTRESRINSTKKQEIHEAVLDFYGDYVYKNNYCSREDFFDALLSSQLRQRIPELIKLLDRDNKYLSGHYMYEDFIKEFMEGLKKATKGLDRFKKSVYSVVNVNRRNLVLLEEILKEDAHSTLPLTDLSHHIRKGTIRIIAIKDPNGSKFIAYRTYFKEGKGIYVDRTFIRHEYRQKGLLLLLNEYCMEHFDYIRIHVLPDELRDKAISRQAHKKIEKMKKQYKMLGFTEESNGLVWRKQGGGKKAFFSKTLQDIRSIYSNL